MGSPEYPLDAPNVGYPFNVSVRFQLKWDGLNFVDEIALNVTANMGFSLADVSLKPGHLFIGLC